MKPFPFSRILAVDTGSHPDAGLLDYATMLASCSVTGSVAMAAGPTLDAIFAMAREMRSDLLVLRRPRGSSSPVLIRHLICLAPCPVCLLPQGAAPSLTRALVRLSLTPRGRWLLGVAASVARHAGAGELLAAHNAFDYDVDEHSELADRFRTRHELEIYRFLARAELSGINCTPVRTSQVSDASVLLDLARRREADLLVVDPVADGAPVWQWNRRDARRLVEMSPVPVLSIGLGDPDRSWSSVLREEVFTEMEPKFN